MKTAMQELIDNLESIDINVPNGVKLIFIEKEKEQMFYLIRFMRTNDKMGKSVEDLYNEFIKQ